jgi:hypothetical protein
MDSVVSWRAAGGFGPVFFVVVVIVGFSTKHIETVDLVEYVKAADISIRTKAVDVGPASHDLRIVAIASYFVGAEWDGIDVSDSVPGHVDFGAGVLAENARRVVGH